VRQAVDVLIFLVPFFAEELEDLDTGAQVRERTRHVREDPLKQERLVDAVADIAEEQGTFFF
jgi:hypothetical protein